MTTIINANTSAGLVSTADTSGIVKLQSNGVTTNALAWVNFNGTGTVAIRSAYNVSSITDNGTGDYTVNFTNALSDANYAISVNGYQTSAGGSNFIGFAHGATYTTTACRTFTVNGVFAATDMQNVSVLIFGN